MSEAVAVAGTVLLAIVFLAAAVGKTVDRAGFSAVVRAIPAVPGRGVAGLALAVPIAEAGVAVALLLAPFAPDPWVAWAATGAALALLAGFSAVIVQSLTRGSAVRCACFGGRGARFAPRHLVRNALLALVAAVAGPVAAGVAPLAPAVPLLLAAACGAVPAVLVITMDDLVDLFRPTAGSWRAASPGGRP